ncbi:MAG TPA: aconitate hydratase AcnA, partial [Gemmatimonadaceae bacterium]|nr:aconitate hydratase AcnA [Gemmatimonadaceae bacterium]
MASKNSFGSRATLNVDGKPYVIYRLDALKAKAPNAARLPFSLKILLENLLRNEDGAFVKAADIESMGNWDVKAKVEKEIAFRTSRVLLQDFTGVPAVVDLAAMRDALKALGGDPNRINPLQPVDLVIDHSVQVDEYGTDAALLLNTRFEFERNQERYVFLRWGQSALNNFRVVPPGTGICHQVNLEYLGQVVFTGKEDGQDTAYCDSLVGTDSHTTMINGLGVLGWGVGGIEAEAAMLGQPVSMLIPRVVGFKLTGALPEGATATDLVLTVTELLRRHGVVGKFVEFYGDGVAAIPVANRATIANMSPEYGSTCAIFPIDAETLRYLELTGRTGAHIALVEAYAKEQGLWHEIGHELRYSEHVELDLATVVPSLAGPTRPQDRVRLDEAKASFRTALPKMLPGGGQASRLSRPVEVELVDGTTFNLDHGCVVIAAITSCTNTSNPWVMIGAGLLARNAVEAGLRSKAWVKTTLAPGSKVVTGYFDRAGLTPYLDKLGFSLVGYGCTTCIGNSGPLLPEISAAVNSGDLAVVSVLSGNRNFEGRINPDVRMNYLASPPLVVAYALAGTMDVDLIDDPLGTGGDGQPVYLRDIWPSPQEVQRVIDHAVS